MSPADPNLGAHAPVVIFQSKEVTPATLKAPSVMHGVPTCLPTLSEIRITQISANPLGSHVLLISSEALLFSYGQNDYGQLGLGLPLDTFVRTPTIVTAILEGGGKAVSCSAGVCHSLIVVKTEEQRVLRKAFALQRAISSPSRLGGHDGNSSLTPNNPDDLVLYHHQVYGFGASRNLGLMNSENNAAACVSLPHRVALHAKVWPEREASSVEGLPPAGVFQVEAALNHSAALVRRATGAIELYTWGDQSLALGGGGTGLTPSVPTKVESLSYKPLSEVPNNGNGSYLKDSEHLQQVYLGPDCTFVMTNTGRCMSFGTNHDGLLGIGKYSASVPTDISFPTEDSISSISIGAQHAMATSCNGKAYVWGADPALRRTSSRPEPLAGPTIVAATAFAGYDASALVTQSGVVQTCGQKSGRLGQGEVPPNPRVPTRLFGGLRLWREQLPPISKSADV
jgi:alpha-tubulin suppressor-like RCC1 family protein